MTYLCILYAQKKETLTCNNVWLFQSYSSVNLWMKNSLLDDILMNEYGIQSHDMKCLSLDTVLWENTISVPIQTLVKLTTTKINSKLL